MPKYQVQKIANFLPKSKAIGLDFCPNSIDTKIAFFYAKISGQKIPIFLRKSKAIGLHFCQKLIDTKNAFLMP